MQREFFLYGEILGSTSKAVADFLDKNKKSSVTIRINSGGGNVFSGLAINSLLKNHGNAIAIIDGICGSAATIAAVGAKQVKAAKNSLFVIHNPAVALSEDVYQADELEQLKNSLDSIKNSVVESYTAKTKIDAAKIAEMLNSEKWFSAKDAKELGFIDEIIDEEAEIKIDNFKQIMFVNKVAVDCRNFKKLPITQEVKEVANSELENAVKSAITAERKRFTDLNALRCENTAVNKIIDLAIGDGKTVAEIQPYIDAVKSALPAQPAQSPIQSTPPSGGSGVPDKPQNKALETLVALISDNLKSGAEGVEGGTTPPMTDAEKQEKAKAAQADLIAQYTNQVLKGGVK